MSFYTVLAKAHSGMAMLLVFLAVVSLLMAAKVAASSANEGFMKKANTVGLVETIIAGVVTLTGLITMFMGPWSLLQLWLWIGLVIMVLYSILLKRLTKPARLAVAEGGSGAKWVGLQFVHVLLLIIAFALMKSKSF